MNARRAILLAGAGGAFGSLDTALNIAFPDLASSFDVEVADLQWVVISFVLSYGGLLLAAGQLGDRIGHRRMLMGGAAGSMVAMVLCAVAPSFGWFLGARVLQGITTAMVMAAAPALAIRAAGSEHRGRAAGVFQMSAGIGGAVGPIVGGPLVELGGWPAVFWFRVPVAFALFGLALTVREDAATPTAKADVVGAIVTSIVLAGALLTLNSGGTFGWTSPVVLMLVFATLALGTAHVRRSLRHPDPIVDLRLFRIPAFATANFLTVAANGSMFVAWLLVPTLVVVEMGSSTFVGGLVLAASPLAMALTSPHAGRWADRSGAAKPVAVGVALEAVGLVVLGFATAAWSPIWVGVALAIVGVGLGLFGAPNMAQVMGALPTDQQGVAGGLTLMMRTSGIVVGVAASGALFGALEPSRGFGSAFHFTVGASAIAAAGAALVSLTSLRRD
jgi:EmrB/QacA subfamily drug resistance transporter